MSDRTDTQTRSSTSDDVDLALCRSAGYVALACGFAPVDQELHRRVASPEGANALQCALDHLGVEATFTTPACTLDELVRRREQLFGHTVRGEVTPYETEFGVASLFRQPREMQDIAGFFEAFGLRLPPERHERIDHVRCECEFMAFLARKEAYCRSHRDTETASRVEQAARLFLRDHLGHFAPALGAGMQRADEDGFYGALGDVLRRFVEWDCARLGVEPGPPELRLRVAVEGDVPAACADCPSGPGP
jgi:DMSO reductase family type II enzyme chaperone